MTAGVMIKTCGWIGNTCKFYCQTNQELLIGKTGPAPFGGGFVVFWRLLISNLN